jgi:hypothetical protein
MLPATEPPWEHALSKNNLENESTERKTPDENGDVFRPYHSTQSSQ